MRTEEMFRKEQGYGGLGVGGEVWRGREGKQESEWTQFLVAFSSFPEPVCHEVMRPDAMILFF